MAIQANPYTIPLLFSGTITFGLAIFAWRRRQVTAAVPTAYALLGTSIWSFADALRWASANYTTQVFFAKMVVIGSYSLTIAFVFVVLHHAGLKKFANWRLASLILLFLLPSFILIWTNEYHHLYWSNVKSVAIGSFTGLDRQMGFAYWLDISINYIFIFVGIMILFNAYFRSGFIHRKQMQAILLAAVFPLLGNIASLPQIAIFPYLDLTPFSFTLSGIALAYAVFRYQLFYFVPMARRAIIHDLQDGVVVVDKNMHITDINPSGNEILGVDKKTIIGAPLERVIPGWEELIESHGGIDNLQERQVEIKERFFELRVSQILNDEGQLFGNALFLHDVSEHLRIEADLEEVQRTFASVLDTLEDSYFETDLAGVITYVNAAFTKNLKFSKEEVVGKHFRHFVHQRSIRDIVENFQTLYETEKVQRLTEYHFVRKNGEEIIGEISVSLIRKGKEVIGTRGLIQDITARKKAENIVREARDKAETIAGELAAINHVATIVNKSLDLDETVQAACEEIVKIFPVRNTSVGLLDRDQTRLEITAFHSINPAEENIRGMVLTFEGNIASQEVIDNKKTVVIEDAQNDPRTEPIHEMARASGARSYMIVPLLARGRAIGIIGMPAKNPAHTFTEKETKLAETIASQIAAAVDNARLYGQTEMALDTAKRDLEIGHEIQSGFFPEVVPQIPGWDIAAYFQGARQVAGDFYDVFQFKNSPFTAFVIADVCDKGVGAALFMVLFRSLLRAFSDEPVRGANIPERLKEIVLKTNIFIAEYHGQSNMFATMFFGILDPDSDTLYYINGGHEPPIMMDKEGKVTQRIRPTGPAVGLFSDMSFTVEEIQFNKGDILVSFTDGVPDAIDDARELFSEKRLLKSIQAPWTSAFSMLYELNADLQKHIGEQAQFDDVTLLSLRRKHTLKIDHHAICRIADTKALSELREFAERAAIECNLSHDIVFAFKLATEEILVT
ncbi:MAG: SpoIIE family protein phosphatase [Anaerolineae bacterium]|nr:SpoIIE family protein phosphatase [Anaerolineae bacterium]